MEPKDAEIRLSDGRTLGYVDYGTGAETAVLWCHGGPGSRLEPKLLAPEARSAGLRLIGIDRPGYGRSTPRPGRAIADFVPDALALADALGIARFALVGVSTGGAYALAIASRSERALGVVACCALTDMRDTALKDAMVRDGGQIAQIWNARDRDAALAVALESFGPDGMKMMSQVGSTGPALPPADMALLGDPTWLAQMAGAFPAMFAQGVAGYADDRLADGPGWGSFEPAAIRCPVIVLHGAADTVVPVEQAHHTAKLVPGATLQVVPELGHFSIMSEVLGALRGLLARAQDR